MIEPDTPPSGLSPREVSTMRSVEDGLWWYRALRAHVLNSITPSRADFHLLDAGCGTGGMLARIRERFPHAELTGIDLSEAALEMTRERATRAELIHGSTNELPFADRTFDVALSLDVLAFRGVDDGRAVGELHRVLRTGGIAIINLPAFDFLRGSHDAAVSQDRRYTRAQLARLLRRAGFAQVRLSYWNLSLLPAVAAVRMASRRRAHAADVSSDLAPLWAPLNSLLTLIARVELAASRYIPLPLGTSIFAVARK
ncbi:MAG: class I SAM-dependent methyltransferase [Verrucomicrobiota bacterium]|nr:class I SAM-dependent methyltransferase [Verrucomicrobiota bacterium]